MRMAYTKVLDLAKKGLPLPLDFAAFEGLGLRVYNASKAKRAQQGNTDGDAANKNYRQVPTPAIPVDERLVDVDTVDQVTDDDSFDMIEVSDEEEEEEEEDEEEDDEPLIRRYNRGLSTKNKPHASIFPIENEPMEIDSDGQIAEDMEEDEPLARARPIPRQADVSMNKEPTPANIRGKRLANRSAVSTDSNLDKGKGKERAPRTPSPSPIGPSSLPSFASGSSESVQVVNGESQDHPSSAPVLNPIGQSKRQAATADSSSVSLLQALDLTGVPMLHQMKVAIINELLRQDTQTAGKMLQLDKRVTKILNEMHEKIAIKEVHWTEDVVLLGIKDEAKENKKLFDASQARLNNAHRRLNILEKAEQERKNVLTQIMALH